MIKQELLDILACPACDDRPKVTLTADGKFLACPKCRRRYPIENDIPVMLPDAALLPDGQPAARAPDVRHTMVEPADTPR